MPGLIDREHLASQTFGDAALARELLVLFARQCRRLLPAIADPAAAPAGRADSAHTLKGSALGVGAARVARLCGAAEDALRGSGPPDTALLDALAEAVGATLAEIDAAA